MPTPHSGYLEYDYSLMNALGPQAWDMANECLQATEKYLKQDFLSLCPNSPTSHLGNPEHLASFFLHFTKLILQ